MKNKSTTVVAVATWARWKAVRDELDRADAAEYGTKGRHRQYGLLEAYGRTFQDLSGWSPYCFKSSKDLVSLFPEEGAA